MAGAVQPLTGRRVVALAASAAALALPGVGLAGNNQDGDVVQASEATAVALVIAPVSGATCFVGCPTIAVSVPTAVAVSFNVAAVVQLLSQSLGLAR